MQNNGGACRPAGAGGGLPVPGLLIGLSSPLLRREGGGRLVAGWAGRGQANGGAVRGRDGQSWLSNCAGANLSTGPDTLPIHRSLPQRVAMLVVWSTLALRQVLTLSQLGPSITHTRVPVTHSPPEVSGCPQLFLHCDPFMSSYREKKLRIRIPRGDRLGCLLSRWRCL